MHLDHTTLRHLALLLSLLAAIAVWLLALLLLLETTRQLLEVLSYIVELAQLS